MSKDNTLKSAILGTQQTGDDARDVLRQAGIVGFQRMGGYVACECAIDECVTPTMIFCGAWNMNSFCDDWYRKNITPINGRVVGIAIEIAVCDKCRWELCCLHQTVMFASTLNVGDVCSICGDILTDDIPY